MHCIRIVMLDTAIIRLTRVFRNKRRLARQAGELFADLLVRASGNSGIVTIKIVDRGNIRIANGENALAAAQLVGDLG